VFVDEDWWYETPATVELVCRIVKQLG
jgi:hypothetical protein